MAIKPNNYKKILVLHGGFEAGDSALAHGINLAKLSNGSVTILHVVNIPKYPMESISNKLERIELQKKLQDTAFHMKKTMEQEFQKKIKKYNKNKVKTSLVVLIGPTLQKVLEYEKKNNFNLIVMGKSKGSRSVESRSVVGGLTIKLLEQLRCPTLMLDVPVSAKFIGSR
ncbi:universal stress protein [Nitrosopumilus adriaticus]|uniref:Putative Universal stress family protein n=1 Tax=Nitrosopumilus adriaticus TaxID=1580092 RepID=A0A0D5C3Z8_9ARCH|nr:universal stress protein [Nitrosopumilus adriaticus]AJW71524.1 putative Universal stress family protein [Nitrosopumilus adriaticus]